MGWNVEVAEPRQDQDEQKEEEEWKWRAENDMAAAKRSRLDLLWGQHPDFPRPVTARSNAQTR